MADDPFEMAPDFTLQDMTGRTVRLSDFRGRKHVVLVFSRGFVRPTCRRQMAQLRQDYAQLTASGVEVVVIGPEDRHAFVRQWHKEHFAFVGLPDPQERVSRLYSAAQGESTPFARAPDWVLIDKEGRVRHAQHRSWVGGAADGGVLEALRALTERP